MHAQRDAVLERALVLDTQAEAARRIDRAVATVMADSRAVVPAHRREARLYV